MNFDETKMYRCDTPVIFKITNFNWQSPNGRSETVIQLHQVNSHSELWGAVYPAAQMDWKVRRKIKWWLVPIKTVDYLKYALEDGQLCPCNRHKQVAA